MRTERKRDKQRVREKAGERCELSDSVVTQLLLNSRELLRRESDFLNYLPLCVNRNTHLWPCFHMLIPTRLLSNRAGGCFHVVSVVPTETEKILFLFSILEASVSSMFLLLHSC